MIFDSIKKFIFPSRCVICDTLLPYGDKLENEYICDECRSSIEFIKSPTCEKCGAAISEDDDRLCSRCKNHLHQNFKYGFGLCRYNDLVKESLHRIKYSGRKEYIDFYGKMIAKAFRKRFKAIDPDCFIPVPIHKKRLLKRNFNQAAVLAESISKELRKYDIDIPVNENVIFRKKNTAVLNKLAEANRKEELDDAFTINRVEDIEKAVIIDDIYTTGATIDKVALKLKNAGIKDIYFTVIAIVDNL